MNEIYTIYSDRGDEYRLQLTTERSGIIANVLLDQLAHDGIEVVEIGLARVKGSGVTGHKVLGQIVVVLCQKTALGNYVKRYCNPSQRCNVLCVMVLWNDGGVIGDGWGMMSNAVKACGSPAVGTCSPTAGLFSLGRGTASVRWMLKDAIRHQSPIRHFVTS